MKKILILIMFVSTPVFANDFKMRVEKVELLQGLILKGLAMTGTVLEGCIGNEEMYKAYRVGKEVLKTDVRILNIDGLKSADEFDGVTRKGDKVTFYLPDGKEGAIEVGDIFVSKATQCKAKKP